MEEIRVADVMTRDPVTVPPETTLYDCAKKMVRKNVGSVLLVEKNRLRGILTEQDILWAMIKQSRKALKDIVAIEISPKKIATTRPEVTLREAIEKMKQFKFERLPVLHKKELAGMLTVRDILSFYPEAYTEIEEFKQIREFDEKIKRKDEESYRQYIEEGESEEEEDEE